MKKPILMLALVLSMSVFFTSCRDTANEKEPDDLEMSEDQMDDVNDDANDAIDDVQEAGRDAGDAIENAAKETGDAVEGAAKKVESEIDEETTDDY